MKHLGKLAAGVALALIACGAHAAQPTGLEISLAPVTSKSAHGTGKVLYSITNRTSASLLVLAWETPLRGVDADLFDVRQSGKSVTYVGREFKRHGVPSAEDYIEIAPGQTLSKEVDLATHYAMDVTGEYAAQAHGHFHDTVAVRAKRGGGEVVLPISDRDVLSDTTFVWVDGARLTHLREPTGIFSYAKAGSVGFVGCSSTQQSSISSGVSAAKSMSASANSYLAAGTVGPRYTTWFGAYSSSNYNTVKSNFAAIGDALNNKPLVFDCSTCTMSAYAYVYPTQPYKVYLCGAYWKAPTSGTDSKGGTTIHEVSHFNVVAGTDDLAYGQTACKRLAGNAKRAIKNADSHEYFGENTPSLN
jgi:peptidyl-Lys metalloendopeptidase